MWRAAVAIVHVSKHTMLSMLCVNECEKKKDVYEGCVCMYVCVWGAAVAVDRVWVHTVLPVLYIKPLWWYAPHIQCCISSRWRQSQTQMLFFYVQKHTRDICSSAVYDQVRDRARHKCFLLMSKNTPKTYAHLLLCIHACERVCIYILCVCSSHSIARVPVYTALFVVGITHSTTYTWHSKRYAHWCLCICVCMCVCVCVCTMCIREPQHICCCIQYYLWNISHVVNICHIQISILTGAYVIHRPNRAWILHVRSDMYTIHTYTGTLYVINKPHCVGSVRGCVHIYVNIHL